MKVTCDRVALVEAVKAVGPVAVGRSPSPVLQCVKLTAKDGLLTFAATDLEIGLRLGLDQVEVKEPGEALVPADKLMQIVCACSDPTLILETKEHTLHIRGKGTHFSIFGFDPKEASVVQEFPDADKMDCEIDAGLLRTLLSRTLFATAHEHSRYAINGVLFERDGKKLRMVATDGRRLSLARGEATPTNAKSGKVACIIPSKALTLLVKLLVDPEAKIKMAITFNHAVFSVGEGEDAAVLSTNLVEGAFPPFDDVIPKDCDKKATFDATKLANAIRQAALLTNEESKGVRLSFADKMLTINSRAPEKGEAEIHVDLEKYDGEPLAIGFNPGFITDALKVVDGSEITIELKAPNKPGLIRCGNDFSYVIMPINLPTDQPSDR